MGQGDAEYLTSAMGADDFSFDQFMQRLRAGDETAALEVVKRFEPAVRRAIRVRLRDPRLRRIVETVDICQSVFASFFVRTSLGQYDLQTPEKLAGLLVAIARNKVAHQANRERAACRDQRRINPGAVVAECADPGPTASRQLAARELVFEARRRMTADELVLIDLREQGAGWKEIADELGGSPDAQRVRLARAVARVSKELGLDDAPDE